MKKITLIVGLMLVGLLTFAGLTNFPNGVSSFGIPVLGSGGLTTTGSVFFVDSTAGSDGNNGLGPDQALKTLEYALESKVTSAKGDIVALMPGFAETVTSAIAWSADSVKVVGIGPLAGQHNLTTATTGINLIDMTGDYCTIENLRITNTSTDVMATEFAFIDVSSTGSMFTKLVFEFDDSATGVNGINISGDGGFSDNTIDKCQFITPGEAVAAVQYSAARTTISNCDFDLSNGGAPVAIEMTAAGPHGCTISGNIFRADSSDTVMITWNASAGAGHVVIRNWCLGCNEDTDVLGLDTELDECFIENYNGVAAGTTTVIDPSI